MRSAFDKSRCRYNSLRYCSKPPTIASLPLRWNMSLKYDMARSFVGFVRVVEVVSNFTQRRAVAVAPWTSAHACSPQAYWFALTWDRAAITKTTDTNNTHGPRSIRKRSIAVQLSNFYIHALRNAISYVQPRTTWLFVLKLFRASCIRVIGTWNLANHSILTVLDGLSLIQNLALVVFDLVYFSLQQRDLLDYQVLEFCNVLQSLTRLFAVSAKLSIACFAMRGVQCARLFGREVCSPRLPDISSLSSFQH